MDGQMSLLDQVWKRVGCAYLSDLPDSRYGTKVVEALESLRAGDYSLKEWRELVRYLTGQDWDLSDQGELREELLRQLKQIR